MLSLTTWASWNLARKIIGWKQVSGNHEFSGIKNFGKNAKKHVSRFISFMSL